MIIMTIMMLLIMKSDSNDQKTKLPGVLPCMQRSKQFQEPHAQATLHLQNNVLKSAQR